MLAVTKQHLKCEFCGKVGVDCQPCQFCMKIVCVGDAHYLPTREQTIYGYKNKVLRVCPECTPTRRLR